MDLPNDVTKCISCCRFLPRCTNYHTNILEITSIYASRSHASRRDILEYIKRRNGPICRGIFLAGYLTVVPLFPEDLVNEN